MLTLVRYGIPALLLVAGVVVLAVRGFDAIGLEVAFLFAGAAASVLLLNVLFRMGVSGDRDRAREARAREIFDRTGRWPDER